MFLLPYSLLFNCFFVTIINSLQAHFSSAIFFLVRFVFVTIISHVQLLFVTIIDSSQAHVSLAVFSLAHSLGGRVGAGVPSVEVSL